MVGREFIVDWGVVPNREIDFGFGCGACAKLCAGVRQMFLLGLGPPSRSLCGAGPGRAAAGPSRAVGVRTVPVEKVKKKSFVFSDPDRIRQLS